MKLNALHLLLPLLLSACATETDPRCKEIRERQVDMLVQREEHKQRGEVEKALELGEQILRAQDELDRLKCPEE